MKILHLLYESKGDFFGIGGVGMRAYEIYRHLRDRHDITLLCRKYPGAKDGTMEGLRHIFVGSESTNFTRTLLSYACGAARFVREKGDVYDVIIEEFSPAIPTFLPRFTSRPIILQLQGYTGRIYFEKYNPLYALTLCLMERLRPRSYGYFVFMNRETVTRFSLEQRRGVEIIPNGVSSELLDLPYHEGGSLLSIGRIDIHGKGLDLLLEAYKEFCRFSPAIRLKIAGDGRDRERFKRLLEESPAEVRGNVDLLGWVSGRTKIDAFRDALCVIFPSRHEVQPIAVLEAMACGKPVIVSDIPEFSFITEGRAGMAFKSGDARSLAQSLKDLAARTGAELGEMGLSGRNLVREYTWDKIALRFEKFLCEVNELHRHG